jgi:hypothetical protein
LRSSTRLGAEQECGPLTSLVILWLPKKNRKTGTHRQIRAGEGKFTHAVISPVSYSWRNHFAPGTQYWLRHDRVLLAA